MVIGVTQSNFAGMPVVDWDLELSAADFDPASIIYRISSSGRHDGEDWRKVFSHYLKQAGAEKTTGIVVGFWADPEGSDDYDTAFIVKALVDACEKLPALTAIFLADVTADECEISWIKQSNVSRLFDVFPLLTHFGVRGGDGLSLGFLKHDKLKQLIIQTGGLSRSVVREIGSSQLPALEHLELWLGASEYGSSVTVDDVRPILFDRLFPRLKYLGLRDSEIADEIARALFNAPVLKQIEILDLSMGTLGDEGGRMLLTNPSVLNLKTLDLHFHYMSQEMCDRLSQLSINIDLSQPQGAREHRYVSVGE